MKVTIVRGGGLAGLVRTTTVDEAWLAPEDARTLRVKVDQAGLFTLPEHVTASGRQPDRFTYQLTVADAGRRHTVHTSEEDLPESLGSFIAWARSVPGRQEQLGPPG